MEKENFNGKNHFGGAIKSMGVSHMEGLKKWNESEQLRMWAIKNNQL